MPGVVVTTSLRTGAAGANAVPASTLFLVGVSERGPSATPIKISSFADFEKYFGDYTSGGTLYQYMQTYFDEGGLTSYVQRAASGGVEGTVSASSAPASPVVVFKAVGAGTWSEGTATTGVRIIVDTTDTTTVLTVKLKGVTVWVSAPLASRDAVVAAVNANVGWLITASNGAFDALPADGTHDITGGSAPDTPTAAHHTNLLSGFGYELGPGVVIIADYDMNASSVGVLLGQHAAANNRLAFAAGASTQSTATVITNVGSIGDALGVETSSHVAAFYPWINVPIRVRNTSVSTITIPMQPTVYAAAKRAQAHLVQGPWRAGAGELGITRMGVTPFVSSNSPIITKTVGDLLDAGRVNALRNVNGALRLYGARSISKDDGNWRFYTARDTINYAVGKIETALEPYTFRPIDSRGSLFAEVAASCVAVLELIRIGGGIFEQVDEAGVALDRGYSVLCNATNNPTSQIANGLVQASISLRVSTLGDSINVTIYKTGLTSGV